MSEEKVWGFSVVFHRGGFIVFGGCIRPGNGADGKTTVVAGLNEAGKQWTQLGNLINARNGHAVIHDGLSFLVVGGQKDRVFSLR